MASSISKKSLTEGKTLIKSEGQGGPKWSALSFYITRYDAFFRVKQAPTIAPIKASGAILTNDHSTA